MNLIGEGRIAALCGMGAPVERPCISEPGARHSHSSPAAGCMKWQAGRPSFLFGAMQGLSGQAL